MGRSKTKPAKPARGKAKAQAKAPATKRGAKAPLKAPPKPTAKAPAPATNRGKPIDRARSFVGTAKPKPTAPQRRRSEPAVQTELPGTEQVRDDVLEREFVRLQEAKQEIAAAQEVKHTAEANIQRRFDEFDEDDPRRTSYRVRTGELLRPQTKPVLKITRPPSKDDKARRKAAAAAAATDPANDPDAIPNGPDVEDGDDGE